MSEIILWSLLAFFGAFGLVEFVRFVYTDWNSNEDDFYVVIHADKAGENLEAVIRNALIATGTHSVLVLNDDDNDDNLEKKFVLKRLQDKYENINIITMDKYIDLLKR